MEVKFTACEHLDYEPHYGDCKRQQIMCGGRKLCWKRAVNGNLVQFCKLRGRINNLTGCLSEATAACTEYNEVEHAISVSQEENDS